jgi:hypothetical protein
LEGIKKQKYSGIPGDFELKLPKTLEKIETKMVVKSRH